jgi:very-short-patch-repair endonuclease
MMTYGLGSDGERALETHLRAVGLRGYVREYRFDPSRRWRFDFAWLDRRLAVEVEGGTFIGGRHNRGRAFEGDAEKYNAAAVAGWLVLRVTTDMVEDGRAVATVERAFAARAPG